MDRYILNNKAFSLVELAIAIGVIAVLTTAVAPIAIRAVEIKAGEKTITEVSFLQEAARHFYKDRKDWPANFQELKDGGYINAAWSIQNPWGNDYVMAIVGSTLEITTDVPENMVELLSRRLPQAYVSGKKVTSTLTSPGIPGDIASGVIVAWSGLLKDIPKGWVLCDGKNHTPDLQDKFIVGANINDNDDPKGIARTKITGELLPQGGSATHNHGGVTGSHVLTINEMPAHSHSIPNNWQTPQPGDTVTNSNQRGGPWARGIRTGSEGENQGHTHTITSDSNVPPFYALAFIMKL